MKHAGHAVRLSSEAERPLLFDPRPYRPDLTPDLTATSRAAAEMCTLHGRGLGMANTLALISRIGMLQPTRLPGTC